MSTVIKAGHAGKLKARLSTVELADHLAEAQQIIERSRREAAAILAEAGEERERLLADARRAGYEAGYQEGREEGARAGREAAYADATERFDREHANVVSDLTRVIDGFDGMKQDLRIAAERDVLDFAVRLASKLTFSIGRLRGEAVAANLRRALELIGTKTDVRVRAHPQDVAALNEFAREAQERILRSAAVHVVGDDSIAPGGCVVGSDVTEVDARLESQVEELVSLLLPETHDDD